jgi:hypothetical protein
VSICSFSNFQYELEREKLEMELEEERDHTRNVINVSKRSR